MLKCVVVRACAAITLVVALTSDVVLAQPKPIPIRIGWQPDANGVFFIARKHKLFEKVGLQPDYFKFLSGPAMFSAMQSKSLDVSEFAVAPFVAGVANGVPMVAISVAFNEGKVNALVARPGTNIKSIADLKGKKVAATRGSLSYLGLARALHRNKMGFDDIEYLNMPVPQIIPAFQHGDIDAAWAWEPWAQRMVADGGQIIATLDDIVGDVWAAHKDWLKSQPEAAVRFIEAMDLAAQTIRKDPELATADIADALGIPPAMAQDIMNKVESPTVREQLDPNSNNSVMHFATKDKGLAASIRATAEFFLQQGIIKSFPAIDAVFDPAPIMTYVQRQRR
jgi:taurine transport system substrate-binding protein